MAWEGKRAGPVRHRLGVEVEHLLERRKRISAAAFERILELHRGLLSDSNGIQVSKAYYVNSVYANTVDVTASHLEHSRGERKGFKSASPGLGAAHPGPSSRTGVFTGRLRRPLRSPQDIHGNGRTRREQPQLPEHRQGGNDARRAVVDAVS